MDVVTVNRLHQLAAHQPLPQRSLPAIITVFAPLHVHHTPNLLSSEETDLVRGASFTGPHQDGSDVR